MKGARLFRSKIWTSSFSHLILSRKLQIYRTNLFCQLRLIFFILNIVKVPILICRIFHFPSWYLHWSNDWIQRWLLFEPRDILLHSEVNRILILIGMNLTSVCGLHLLMFGLKITIMMILSHLSFWRSIKPVSIYLVILFSFALLQWCNNFFKLRKYRLRHF